MKEEMYDLIGMGVATFLTLVGLGLLFGLPIGMVEHGLCLFNCK